MADSTKKSTARKTTAKKAGAKKAATKKTSTARTGTNNATKATGRDAPRAAAPKRMTGSAVAGVAARQLEDLTGKQTEAVTGLERTDDGWTVTVEVLELRRIPNTTDMLATYEVSVDTDGELEGYRRLHRYVRGTPGEE